MHLAESVNGEWLLKQVNWARATESFFNDWVAYFYALPSVSFK